MKHLITLGIMALAAIPTIHAVSPDAPMPVTSMRAVFPEGGLSGYVEFDAPRQTVGGDEITEMMLYTVRANNDIIAQADAYPGVSYSANVEMAHSGIYTFSVTVSNKAGESEPVTMVAGAGFTPPAEPSPKAEIMPDGSILISWPEVTQDIKGGQIDPKSVRYTVERYPDGHIVAENLADTRVTDADFDGNLHAYRYFVTSIWNAVPSIYDGYTNSVSVGMAIPPYKATFDDVDEYNLFSLADMDGNGRTWEFYQGMVYTREGSGDTDADDWLISPPIRLSENGIHPFSIDLKVHDADFPSVVEVRYGTSDNPEMMDGIVIPRTELSHTVFQTYTGTLQPKTAEPVYIAVRNMTSPDGWWTYATNFFVDSSTEGKVPAAPTSISTEADLDGKLVMKLSIQLPELDLTGNALQEIETLEILRDGEVIATLTDVAVGATVTFTDNEELGLTEGEHTYSAVAINKYGRGMETKHIAYAGINLPASPASARAYENEQNGVVTIEWDPVTTYIDGTPLNPANVKYNVYTDVTGDFMGIGLGITETSYTLKLRDKEYEDDGIMHQIFYRFGVTAETSAGENLMAVMTDHVPLGDPYTTPYEESFPDIRSTYTYIRSANDRHSFWDNASDKFFEEMDSQDGDNGMLYMSGEGIGSKAYLTSAKIDLRGLENPMLTFYLAHYQDEDLPNENEFEVFAAESKDMDNMKSIGKWIFKEFEKEGWNRVAVPLDEFKDKDIRLEFVGTTNNYQYIHLDNIQIRSRVNYDVAVTGISCPERIKSGNDCPIIVSYANYGLSDAKGVTLELLRDGEMIHTESLGTLLSDMRGELTIPAHHSAVTPETVTYEVRLVYAPDQLQANNSVAPFEVGTIYTAYPAVNDLKATYSTDPTELTLFWSEPDMSAAFKEDMVETFENAPAWATSLKDWKFIDGDGMYIWGFRALPTPPAELPEAQSSQSWWIVNADSDVMRAEFSDPAYYEAHSGNQYMVSMVVSDEGGQDVRSDDWAISPELPGIAQTISFWAKAMLDDAPETFEVLYSTTGNDRDSFTSISKVRNVPWTWTQYFFDLPADTKYFAIRSISEGGYVLMVDDVNYTPAGKGSDLTLAGYNIYRDKERINEEPVAKNRYIDVRPNANVNPVYNVTAVYPGRGESILSNDAVPAYSSVGMIEGNLKVISAEGRIIVEGAAGMDAAIYTLDGMAVASDSNADHYEFRQQAGIYLVKVGENIWKVIVR